MNKLGLTLVLCSVALAMVACDSRSGDGPGLLDSGVADGATPALDSGTMVADSGSATVDSGMTSPDAGAPSCGVTGECDLTDSASCGTGRACAIQGSSVDGFMTVCITEGTGDTGSACDETMQGQCRQGLVCLDNICQQFCCSASECPLGQGCSLISGLNGGFCREADMCELVPNSGCPTGQGCYWASDRLQCADAGTVMTGGTCTALNDCEPGHSCVGTSGSDMYTCTKQCRIGMEATDCAAGEMCQVPSGLTLPEGIGLCNAM